LAAPGSKYFKGHISQYQVNGPVTLVISVAKENTILKSLLHDRRSSAMSAGAFAVQGKNILKEQPPQITVHHSNQLWHPHCLEEFLSNKGTVSTQLP
jgi:hypothetical protein